MVLIIFALNSFHVAIEYTQETIDTMTSFLMALFPLLLALIATSGGVLSAAFFHPVLLIFNEYKRNINSICRITTVYFSAAILSIVSTMTDHYKVTQLAQLLRNWAIGILGAFMTVFLGVISVQGTSISCCRWSHITDSKICDRKFYSGYREDVYGCG